MNQYSIRHYDSICGLRQDDWSQLRQAGGFCSYGWLKCIEQHSIKPLRPRYIIAYQKNRPAGGIILELVNDPDRESGVVRSVLGGKRSLRNTFGNWFVPHLAAGAPFGNGGHLLIAAHVESKSRHDLVRVLLAAAEAYSAIQRVPLWFSGVLAHDAMLLDTLRKAGYLSARYLPLAEIDIEWSSFDDYVTSIKQQHKNVAKDIRRARNRSRAAGVEFEEPQSLINRDKRFVELANATYSRHGDLAFPFSNGYFADLKQELGENLVVCNAHKNGKILGFATMISDGQTAWSDSYGVDYSDADSAFAYFNIVLQWPIQKAIELGLKRVVFGRGEYHAKLRRGCTLTDSYILHKPSSALAQIIYPPLFRIIDRHYSRQAGSY